MSHLRDIQRLRQSRNPSNLGLTHRFSQQHTPDIFNVNIETRMTDSDSNPNSGLQKQSYSKFLHSKELLPKTRERQFNMHKRGMSNGNTLYQKKEPESKVLNGGGLSIYNMSMKMGHNRTPNPLTSRRDRKQDYLEFQSAFDLKERKSTRQSIKEISTANQNREISKNSFQILYPIGKGGFGKVWKVEHKKNKQVYALKEMQKAKIIVKKSINSVMNERKLLSKLSHPFIINMSYAFQDRQNLYLIMDYLNGGDLRYHIGRRGKFNEIESKFFICNLIIGLEYMHQNNIIHRDIKPENLVLDKDGYLRITDLGISREYKHDNHQDTSGTPGYMAPQVMVRKNHSFAVDYFAVGVMGYEFMIGRRPYLGKNRKEIRDQILSKQAGIRPEDLPRKWTAEAADFINKLLIRNPLNRLGANGVEELKQHPWLSSVDWKRLEKKQVRAPYVPISIQEDYEEYKDQISEDSIDENEEENMLLLRDKQVQSLFEGYEYDKHRKAHTSTTLQRVKPRSISYTTNCTESEAREMRERREFKEFREFSKRLG